MATQWISNRTAYTENTKEKFLLVYVSSKKIGKIEKSVRRDDYGFKKKEQQLLEENRQLKLLLDQQKLTIEAQRSSLTQKENQLAIKLKY